jgi:hypothetical protein
VTQLSKKPADIVNLVRSVFALDASDAAQVFGVNLSTIYLWLYQNESEIKPVHPTTEERMMHLVTLANECKKLAPLPPRALRATLPDSVMTLLGLLSDDNINHEKIFQEYQYLKSMAPMFRQLEHDKSVKAVIGLKKAFAILGARQAARRKV